MRKSSAPSQRKNFIPPCLGVSSSCISSSSLVDKYKFISKYSSCKDVKEKSDRNIKGVLTTSENRDTLSNSFKKFSVVYGKQTKKKHKTWEGDGFIEIRGKNITLIDEEGKIIGQSTCGKIEEVVESSRIFVGSKEVEILDLLDENPVLKKRCQEGPKIEEDLSPPVKKTKLFNDNLVKPLNTCTGYNSSVKNSKKASNKFSVQPSGCSVEPLIMPRPSEEHQWHCNVNHLPVTDVKVDYCLTKVLRQHQREGVTFLYTCVTGLRSIEYNGAVLADEMGLGKTLQCVTLVWTLLNQGFYGGKPIVKRCLIVVPSSLVKNWYNEFIKWIGSFRIKIYAVDKNNKIQNYSKSPFIPVVIISYEMFIKNYGCLKDIEFDLIICDEGHRLKNSNIQTTVLLNQLPCKKRILLTGTPIQNDLQEFYTLINFVNPGILGSSADFRNNFERVIEASREPKASEDVVALGTDKSKELMEITNNFILRRTQSVIGNFLPPKHEHVLFCSLSTVQKKLYWHLIDYCVRKCDDIISGTVDDLDHLSAITLMKKICNHPSLVGDKFFGADVLKEVKSAVESPGGYISSSVKLSVLDNLISSLEKYKEKIVLVSNFTKTLDVLEKFCKLKHFKYLRYDGSTPQLTRHSIVSNFNCSSSDIGVLLLSSKAGGVGLNLIGASRLILFDSDWNPATDLQAMARIWRDGQKRSVFIYRFLTSGTIEEKIFQRQLKKAGLSESVVDPLSVSAVKLSKEELMDLFEYKDCIDSCITHDSLGCKCEGSGEVPGMPSEFTEDDNLDDDEFDTFTNSFNLNSFDNVNNIPESLDSGKACSKSSENDESERDDERDCEISFSSKESEVMPKSLRMNQLFLWEHHCAPVSSQVLKDIGVTDEVVHSINFLFRNKTI